MSFTTVSTATLSSITFTVPSKTTAGSSLSPTVYGLSADTATAALSSDTVTVTLAGGASIPRGQAVLVEVGGFTNPTSIASFTMSTVTTADQSGTVDTGTSGTVTYASNTTAVTVVVPESLTVTNSATAITLLPQPGSTTATATVAIGVSTNAAGGYTLAACSTGLAGSGPPPLSSTIPAASTTSSTYGTTPLSDAFGYYASTAVTSSATTGGTATLPSNPYPSTGYDGYPTSCTTPQITVNGTTNGLTTTFTNGVQIPASQAAGTYTGMITYQVTPSYS